MKLLLTSFLILHFPLIASATEYATLSIYRNEESVQNDRKTSYIFSTESKSYKGSLKEVISELSGTKKDADHYTHESLTKLISKLGWSLTSFEGSVDTEHKGVYEVGTPIRVLHFSKP
jgi:hypothetical protein